MKLRFTPTVLALVLFSNTSEVGARRRTGEAIIYGSDLAKHSGNTNKGGNDDKSTSRRRAESIIISASAFEQGVENTGGHTFSYPDVGILQVGKSRLHHRRRHFGNDLTKNGRVQHDATPAADTVIIPRSLQAEDEAPPMMMCGTNNGTCPPGACDCIANGGVISDQCAPIFNSLCNNGYTDANGKNWTFEGCWAHVADYPGLQKYAMDAYCKMSECIVDGGSSGSCYCQLYQSLCDTYGDERPYNVSPKLFRLDTPVILKLKHLIV